MEFLVNMENKTRDVETCQMVAISKNQILKIRGGTSCGNSYTCGNSHGGRPDSSSVGDNGP
jgi:hypothetical protein